MQGNGDEATGMLFALVGGAFGTLLWGIIGALNAAPEIWQPCLVGLAFCGVLGFLVGTFGERRTKTAKAGPTSRWALGRRLIGSLATGLLIACMVLTIFTITAFQIDEMVHELKLPAAEAELHRHLFAGAAVGGNMGGMVSAIFASVLVHHQRRITLATIFKEPLLASFLGCILGAGLGKWSGLVGPRGSFPFWAATLGSGFVAGLVATFLVRLLVKSFTGKETLQRPLS
jgi:hypothetical protein